MGRGLAPRPVDHREHVDRGGGEGGQPFSHALHSVRYFALMVTMTSTLFRLYRAP